MLRWLEKHSVLLTLIGMLAGFGSFWANWERDINQKRAELWHMMTHEFDFDRKEQRIACGKAYAKGKLQEKYAPIMDFFETLGELLSEKRIDQKLTTSTFSYYFAGYYMATESFLQREEKLDHRVYSGIQYLHNIWKEDPLIRSSKDLPTFLRMKAIFNILDVT
jgi:hypothetical protein